MMRFQTEIVGVVDLISLQVHNRLFSEFTQLWNNKAIVHWTCSAKKRHGVSNSNDVSVK